MSNMEVAQLVWDSINSKDTSSVAAHLTPDFRVVDRAQRRLFEGDQRRGLFECGIRSFPDLELSHGSFIDSGDVVAVTGVMSGTNTGSIGPYEATSRQVQIPFCLILRFQGDRLSSIDVFYDQLGLLTQLDKELQPEQQVS